MLVSATENVVEGLADGSHGRTAEVVRGLLGDAVLALTGGGDLESNLFSDNEVNWPAIPALVEASVAQLAIEGGVATHVIVHRNLPFSPEIQIRVFVNGTRTSGFVDADAQGSIQSVNPG